MNALKMCHHEKIVRKPVGTEPDVTEYEVYDDDGKLIATFRASHGGMNLETGATALVKVR